MVTISKSFWERPSGKNHHPVDLFSVVSKVFEKLQNNRIVYLLDKLGLFLIFSMVLGLLNQLQIL